MLSRYERKRQMDRDAADRCYRAGYAAAKDGKPITDGDAMQWPGDFQRGYRERLAEVERASE